MANILIAVKRAWSSHAAPSIPLSPGNHSARFAVLCVPALPLYDRRGVCGCKRRIEIVLDLFS
ncbi:MAG TPA: hypothetical protein VLM40_17470 [Gemmata sp.]|nr:hypothetical protein [Gemmata sp.]